MRLREKGLRRGEFFRLRLNTASAQCLRLWALFHFVTYDIYISKYAFPLTILQNIMCKHNILKNVHTLGYQMVENISR